MKKAVSFIIILSAYAIVGGAVLIGTSNFGMGFGFSNDEGIGYAYSLDRAGNIFYTADTGGKKSLVCVDSSGKKLFEKNLDAEIFGESFYVDQIYIEYDKKIFLSVYAFHESTRLIERASVHSFYEDGSYCGEVFGALVSVYPSARSKIISSMSEDDANIYFSLITNGKAELFSAPKNNAEPAFKTAEFEIGEEVYGSIAVSDKSVAVGGADGITIYEDHGKYRPDGCEGAVFDRFWNGISCFYALDSVRGNIFLIYPDHSAKKVVGEGKIVNAEENLTVSDMSEIAVGLTGNIFGTVRAETDHLYFGSFSVMSELRADPSDKSASINRALLIAAVCVGVLLISALTWDFYCAILKMRLSILLRQSLLIALLLFAALYSLLFFLIIPNVERMVNENYIHEAELIANVFENSAGGSASGRESPSREAYAEYLVRYGESCAAASQNAFAGDDEKPVITLAEMRGERLTVIASSELYPVGYPADRLMYDGRLSALTAGMTDPEYGAISRTREGEKLYLIRRVGLPSSDGPAYVIVETGVGGLASAVADVRRTVNAFLLLGGLVIVVIFIMIENITAGAVNRLKRSVDRIANGEYGAPVNIRTGDEVEELSVSVKALARHIIDKTTSLERLNDSYYRFVPRTFLTNLGETRIERVGKSLHARRRMAVLFLRFRFSQPLSGMGAQDIFDSINSVYERMLPILEEFGGTAYNFLFNGLSAIFHDGTEHALRAAIKIRETIGAYNEIQRSGSRRTADVRAVISEGEVLLGFIGDEKRMEPTVVSAAINESEEIERILLNSGLYIVCAESAFRSIASGKYRSRGIGEFMTSEGTVRLYDMFDSDPYALIKRKEQFMTRFELGVSLFRKRDFVRARNLFMEIVKYAPDDGAARNYMYLSEHNISSDRKQLFYTVYHDFTAASHTENSL